MAVEGAGFTTGTTISLVKGGATRAATGVSFVDANHLNATFNLAGWPPGLYDVAGTNGGQTSALAGGFTVNAGPAGSVQARGAGRAVHPAGSRGTD